jgi:hypothetical protein
MFTSRLSRSTHPGIMPKRIIPPREYKKAMVSIQDDHGPTADFLSFFQADYLRAVASILKEAHHRHHIQRQCPLFNSRMNQFINRYRDHVKDIFILKTTG